MNKHRKLFPSLNTTNPTTDCSDYCDPTTETSFPDFYPPIPPSPPPPLPQRHQVSPFLVLSASLLMGFFLLVTYYVVIPKCRFGWCRSRNGNEGRLQQSRSDREAEEFYVDENHDHHPIWYIATVGLQQSVINSITICEYKKSDGLIEGTDCSVCLNEFRENERVRLLPKCNHAFHISCIDTWLSSHTNCPLCRAQIVINPSPTTNSDSASDAHEYEYDEEPDFGSGITNDENREVVHAESASILKTVDSSSAWRICVGLEDIGHIVDAGMIHKCDRYRNKDRNNRIITGRVNSSSSLKEKCLHKSPVLMKRSFSCNGRFCCSSRIKRTPSAILRV